mmetsp:Transcript_37872/g.67874  ORF Transcript_37872/g.67874 Transcript_37872/m.67874 type:complete len:91 (-) Transcript_37872:1613-1885(-)
MLQDAIGSFPTQCNVSVVNRTCLASKLKAGYRKAPCRFWAAPKIIEHPNGMHREKFKKDPFRQSSTTQRINCGGLLLFNVQMSPAPFSNH